MCETSFITVTGTQMQYLATNVRQNLGFHHPPDDRDGFEGVRLIPKARSSLHSWEKKVVFSHILKRNIWKVCALPPKFSAEWRPSKWHKRVKKSSKEATKLAFFGIFGGVFSKGDLGQYFFFGIMTYQKHWNNYWNEKKKFWNFCENAYFFWWICLKNLPCAVNGSEILLNGADK